MLKRTLTSRSPHARATFCHLPARMMWNLGIAACTLFGWQCQAGADVVKLKSGFSIEGHVVDINADPVLVKLPKGNISLTRDMIDSVTVEEAPDGEEGAEGQPEGAGQAPAPVPTIDLKPNLASDEDAQKYFTSVTAELKRIVLRPEEAAVGEEALEPVYVEALGGIGARAVPRLREAIQSESPVMGEFLLKALAKADPAEAERTAKEVLTNHEHPRAREEAVALVAQSRDADRQPLLEKAAADPVWYVRGAAYRELAKDGKPDVLGKVAAGLADEDDDVRKEVRQLLKDSTGQDFEKPEDWQNWVASHPSPAPVK